MCLFEEVLMCFLPLLVDFALKEVDMKGQKLKLQLWDIAGQERFSSMTRVYYKQATAAMIVFDITRPHTFEVGLLSLNVMFILSTTQSPLSS
jgi:small GTP-binding protein